MITRRSKTTLGLVALVALAAVILLRRDGNERKSAQDTRRELRRQGFKTDLADFNFSTSDELRARAAALTTLGNTVRPARRTAWTS